MMCTLWGDLMFHIFPVPSGSGVVLTYIQEDLESDDFKRFPFFTGIVDSTDGAYDGFIYPSNHPVPELPASRVCDNKGLIVEAICNSGTTVCGESLRTDLALTV